MIASRSSFCTFLRLALILTLGLVLLAACSPQAATQAPAAVSTMQASEAAAATPAAPQATQAPAVEATQGLAPTAAPQPTPTPLIEERLVELEWPPRLRLGDSDIIRLSLIPSAGGYTITTEFEDHQTDVQDLPITHISGYDLSAVARLDGVGFALSPEGDQAQFLPAGQPVTWRWSLTPNDPGQQRLTITLLLRWTPTGAAAPARETVAYSRALDVQVISFFGLTRGQTMTGGLLGLFLGGGMSIFALVALANPQRSLLQTLVPNPALAIEPRPGLSISAAEESLLRALFGRYARLVLESEFLSGYSGARTFLAQPIRPDGRADAYTIVKAGPTSDIQREHANYETFVKDTLPPITARIQHVPVTLPKGQFGAAEVDLAALQYTFIAEPGRMPTSLRQALLANPAPALLDKVFETFGPNWWMQRHPYTFRLAQEYDRCLPAHYVIEPAPGRGRTLDGRLPDPGLALGELVTLRGFPAPEKRPDGRSLSLHGTPAPGQPPLRARWLGLSNPDGATGRIAATRRTLLEDFTAGMNRFDLPDPLLRLPALLNENLSGTRSTIHGDLNLENVLTGPGDFVWLIDFAMTRDGHTLYDFAHLEADLIAHLVAPQFASPVDYLAALRLTPLASVSASTGLPGDAPAPFALLAALHTIAGRCLFNPSQPREYSLALCLACLGALKFTNLDAHQRHLLYLTAAWVTASL